jgi:hypothetical protein
MSSYKTLADCAACGSDIDIGAGEAAMHGTCFEKLKAYTRHKAYCNRSLGRYELSGVCICTCGLEELIGGKS